MFLLIYLKVYSADSLTPYSEVDKKQYQWDFPGGPVVKTLPSNPGVQPLVRGSHMTCIQKTQNIKQKQYCIKFSKDLKQVLNTIKIKEAILVSRKGL